MKRLICLLFAAATAIGCSACALDKFSGPVLPLGPEQRMMRSIVRIHGLVPGREGDAFSCSGFSVGNRYYLTAAHCVPDNLEGASYQLRMNRTPVEVVRLDPIRDIALLHGSFDKPAVEFREEPLEWLMPVIALGFGEGFTMPITTHHILQRQHFNMGYAEIYPGSMYTGSFIGGMSGGPVMDEYGKVIGMIQRSNPYLSYGVDATTLQEFLLEF